MKELRAGMKELRAGEIRSQLEKRMYEIEHEKQFNYILSDSENDVPDEEDEDDCPMCYDDRRYNVECAYCHTISRS